MAFSVTQDGNDRVLTASWRTNSASGSDDRFYEILSEIGDMHSKKGQDYGSQDDPYHNVRASESFGVPGWLGAIIRLNDKIVRIQSLAKKGYVVNEAIEDSFRDISVYGIIALVLWEQALNEIKAGEGEIDGGKAQASGTQGGPRH